MGAIVGQFLVGWTMEADDEAFDREKDRIDALEDVGKTDWLPVHIAAQLMLLLVIALHVGLVLSHTVVRRDGQLWRTL